MIFLTIIAYKSSTIKFILNFDHKNSNNLYLNNCPFIRVVIAGIKTYSRTYVSSKCTQRLHELFHAGHQSQLHQHGLKGAEIRAGSHTGQQTFCRDCHLGFSQQKDPGNEVASGLSLTWLAWPDLPADGELKCRSPTERSHRFTSFLLLYQGFNLILSLSRGFVSFVALHFPQTW